MPRWVPVATVPAMAVLVGATVWSQVGAGTGTALLILDCYCAAASLILLPWLLRAPPPAALLLAMLATASPAATPPATLGTLTVAQRRPLRTAVLVGAAGVLAHAIRGWWRPTGGLSYGWWLVLDIAAHVALVGIGALLRAQQSLLWSLRERAAAAEAEQARKIAEARAAERTRIAREMHDVLAHRLSLLATHAGALEYRPDAPPERLAAAAGVLRTGVHAALEDLRQVIGVLRADEVDSGSGARTRAGDGRDADDGAPGAGTGSMGRAPRTRRPQPTFADIPALVDDSRSAGLPVEVADAVDAAHRPPAALGRTAYRIVQEGLTNARKHASDGPVTVRLAGAPGDGLTVTVTSPFAATSTVRPGTLSPSPTDAGPPAPIPGSGTGLVGLAERARLAGGRLQHGVADGRFRLFAWLPWPE